MKKHHESTELESRQISTFNKDMYGGVVYWTVLCFHPYRVSLLFADLLSLYLVYIVMFVSLVLF